LVAVHLFRVSFWFLPPLSSDFYEKLRRKSRIWRPVIIISDWILLGVWKFVKLCICATLLVSGIDFFGPHPFKVWLLEGYFYVSSFIHSMQWYFLCNYNAMTHISRIVWTISITAVKISHEFTRENSQFHPNLHVRIHNFTPKKYLCHSCWSIRERKIRVRWISDVWKLSHTVQTIGLILMAMIKFSLLRQNIHQTMDLGFILYSCCIIISWLIEIFNVNSLAPSHIIVPFKSQQ